MVPSTQAELGVRELLVAGEDLSNELGGLLRSLRPQAQVRFIASEQHSALADQHEADATFLVVDLLGPDTIESIRELTASARTPLIVIASGHGSDRSVLRERVREVGALDCLLRTELSTPLLEAAILHARDHSRHTGGLVELRERFSLVLRGARDGIWEWDLVRNRVLYSQRWRELIGFGGHALPPTLDAWLSRVHPHDIANLRANLEAHKRGEIPIHESEHRIRAADNEWRWVASRALVDRRADNHPIRMSGSLTDISEFRRHERALRVQTRQDPLTKLPDQRVFLERCARCVELAQAHSDYGFIVLLVAVDRLPQIRDSFGVEAAERVVALMATRLRGCLRPDDLMFRFSSGKFSILLEEVDDPEVGTVLAERLHAAAASPFEIGGATTYTTVSIGMTSNAQGHRQVKELVTDVLAATDSAREHGRNRHEVYDASMRVESRALLALEMALRDAIEREQLELHYQPIVKLGAHMGPARAEDLIGFEALLRWEHPELGRVSPVEFIPLAESTGLIVPLGRWVLREAIRTLAALQAESGLDHLCVSVNLSIKQVGDPLLLEALDAALAETGLAPQCLKIELTESVMMDEVEQVSALLQAIRGRGIEIWIDDFGTGYSSLAYLHRFPVDGLKIDRAFVETLDGTSASATLVRAMLGLAENFGLSVVAEGIETEVQAQHLAQLGCTRCQGWLFGRPQDADRIRALLAGE